MEVEDANSNVEARSVKTILVVVTKKEGVPALTPMPLKRAPYAGFQVDFRVAVAAMRAVAETLKDEGVIFPRQDMPKWRMVDLSEWTEKLVAPAVYDSPYPGVLLQEAPEEEVYANCHGRVWPRQTLVSAVRCLSLPSDACKGPHYRAVVVGVKKIH